ncbi:MAG: zinc-dependent alcohol dehydrogenase [Armatimonadota bacterium]
MENAMQAAFFEGLRRLQLREVPAPEPCQGEVVVDIRASGICGSDLHQFEARWEQPQFVPGHEIAGVIDSVGEGVCDWQPGDRVCVEPFLYCGRCSYCMTGRYFHCPKMGFLTLTADGGFAEKMVCPQYTLYRLPDNVDYEAGALAEPLSVAVHAVRLTQLGGADEALILGAGTIGLMAIAAARAFGARKVAVSARHEHQTEAARRLGADVILPTDAEALSAAVEEAFPRGPSVVLETVGSAHGTFQQAVQLAGRLGRVALVGGNTGPVSQFDFSPIASKELTLYGSGAYAQIGTRRDFDIALELLAAEPELYKQLITHRFYLSDIQEGFEIAADKSRRHAIKVMMVR